MTFIPNHQECLLPVLIISFLYRILLINRLITPGSNLFHARTNVSIKLVHYYTIHCHARGKILHPSSFIPCFCPTTLCTMSYSGAWGCGLEGKRRNCMRLSLRKSKPNGRKEDHGWFMTITVHLMNTLTLQTLLGIPNINDLCYYILLFSMGHQWTYNFFCFTNHSTVFAISQCTLYKHESILAWGLENKFDCTQWTPLLILNPHLSNPRQNTCK